MTDERKSAIALIAGSIGGIVTMAIHPTAGHGPLTPNQVDALAFDAWLEASEDNRRAYDRAASIAWAVPRRSACI